MSTIALREAQNRPARCKGCHASITWAITAAGRPIALEAGAPITRQGDDVRVDRDHVHFAKCPQGDQLRKQSTTQHRETEARAAAPAIAQLEFDLRNARERLEIANRLSAAGVAALGRIGDAARTAKRPQLLELIANELAQLQGPRAEHVYPQTAGSNRPRYAGD